MFVIIGSYIEHNYAYGGWDGSSNCIEEPIATFDNEQDAKDYIEESKLKSPIKGYFFKNKSLLRTYESAHVEIYTPENLPHNPKI